MKLDRNGVSLETEIMTGGSAAVENGRKAIIVLDELGRYVEHRDQGRTPVGVSVDAPAGQVSAMEAAASRMEAAAKRNEDAVRRMEDANAQLRADNAAAAAAAPKAKPRTMDEATDQAIAEREANGDHVPALDATPPAAAPGFQIPR